MDRGNLAVKLIEELYPEYRGINFIGSYSGIDRIFAGLEFRASGVDGEIVGITAQ
jgi:hypothetical protein